MIESAQLKNMALRQNSDQELCEAHATQEITSLVTAIDEYDSERNEQIAAMPADPLPISDEESPLWANLRGNTRSTQ